jgi:predicted ATP-grasp superfamily ATP-dependent carboligase
MSQHVLVLDCYRHTLTVIRSLSKAGYKVTLGVNQNELNRGYVHASRHVNSTWLHPDLLNDPAGFDANLLDFLNRNPQLKLIFPVGENSVRRLVSIRANLPRGVVVLMPENAVVETCLDKPSSYGTANECQIPIPETRFVNSSEELRDAVGELGFPSIAKASDSRSLLADRKCVFIRNQFDLESLVDNWPDGQSNIIVQREIVGTRINCDLVAGNGQIGLYFESKILRTNRYDYSGYSVIDRSIPPDPLLRKYCQLFVEELNYTGLGLIQFLKDAHTGKCYFLEANPRVNATIALAVHCGLDMPAAAVRAHDGVFPVSDKSYPSDRTRIWLAGDLLGLYKAIRTREIGLGKSLSWLASAFANFFRADCHATFSWEDPKPTMIHYSNFLVRSLAGNKQE